MVSYAVSAIWCRWCDVTWLLPMVNSVYSYITRTLSTWQPPNVLLYPRETLTTKACQCLIATLALTTAIFWQGGLTAILPQGCWLPTHAAASLDTSCPSTIPLSSGTVANKDSGRRHTLLRETEFIASSAVATGRRMPTSTLFYQTLTTPLFAQHASAYRKITLHASLWLRIRHSRSHPSRSRQCWNSFSPKRVRAGEIKLYKCWSPLDLADVLTKSLPRPSFHKHTPFMYGTNFPYWPFADPGAYIFIFFFFGLVSCTSSPLSRHCKFGYFWFPFLEYLFSFKLTSFLWFTHYQLSPAIKFGFRHSI